MWRFLPSEKLVIVAMIEDPSRTDAEIAEVCGMRTSTVATVRRRLLDAGAVFYINIPSFNKLGCEMIAFSKGVLNPAVSSDVKTDNYLDFCNHSPEIFDAIIGSQAVMFLSVLKSSADMEDQMLRHNKFFSGTRKPSKARLSTIAFPYELSRGTYTTNFAPLVHRFFKLDTPRPKPRPPVTVEVESPDLSENEKKVLVALVESPISPDREIATCVGLSRQTVTRIRHKLLEEEYCTFSCIPRLYRWGFEIFSTVHVRFAADFVWSDKFDAQPSEPVDYSFYSLLKPDEAVASHMISTFQDFTEGVEAGLAWYHKEKAFDQEPDITLMSLEHCVELKTFEFVPALRSVLGLTNPHDVPPRANV